MQFHDLKKKLKINNLNGLSRYTKQAVVDLLKEKGIPIVEKDQEQFNNWIDHVNKILKCLSDECKSYTIIQDEINKLIDKLNSFTLVEITSSSPNFQHLKTIRNNSKKVTITDL